MLSRLPFAILLLLAFCAMAVNRQPLRSRNKTTINWKCEPRSCGFTPIKPRLDPAVQIATTIPYSWPWVVALCGPSGPYPEQNVSCTDYGLGTIVGRRWILAGYADLPQELVDSMRVRTGTYSWLRFDEPGSRLYAIAQIHAYPMTPVPSDPDCAVVMLELTSELEYDDHVQPVCLAAHDHLLQNNHTSGWVTGWRFIGDAVERNMSQWHIAAVKNFLPAGPTCYFTEEAHYASMMVGAPLVKRHGQRWFQYGVVGRDLSYAAGFARLNYYCDWIAEVTRGEVVCSRKMEGVTAAE